ncbi:MAG: NrdR family transcriptional regulator [Candidatus Thorarchaeota archaeon]
MKCPNCESETTRVVTVRKVDGISVAFRERYCRSCQSVFNTTETPDDPCTKPCSCPK